MWLLMVKTPLGPVGTSLHLWLPPGNINIAGVWWQLSHWPSDKKGAKLTVRSKCWVRDFTLSSSRKLIRDQHVPHVSLHDKEDIDFLPIMIRWTGPGHSLAAVNPGGICRDPHRTGWDCGCAWGWFEWRSEAVPFSCLGPMVGEWGTVLRKWSSHRQLTLCLTTRGTEKWNHHIHIS